MNNRYGKRTSGNGAGLPIVVGLLSLFLLLHPVVLEGQRNNLVSVEWLSKNLGDPGIVILDASPAQAFKASHIPGALNYDLFSYGPRESPVPEIENLYQSWGISPGKKIIIYDQGGTYLATRLLFSLDYYGFPGKDMYVLDGGVSKWKESGYTLTSDVSPLPHNGTFTIMELNTPVRADLPEFLEASGDPVSNSLVEALDPSWHYGELNVFGRQGHIPHAIMLPVADLYNQDKTFKSNDEIQKMLDYLGIHPGQTVYTHCGGGIAASVPYFVMKYMLGWPDVKLFPGSQLEWAADVRELPFWTYDAPYLIRDAGWLRGWGGRMMRMYGISNISLIDVRSPEAFRESHLDYAVHLMPGELYRFLTSKAGADFSSIKIDPSSEAVIISGGGLTREAALAFAVLENAGHQKISLFIDPENEWEQSGLSVIKGNNQTGESKEVTGPSGTQPFFPGEGIIVADPQSINGTFQGIVLTCGESETGKTMHEKSIHVPYTHLLNDDGTPKKANEIWNILSEAGVPRYARLVCYSDDPGEAAVVYFLLRLMGYPDTKIMYDPGHSAGR